METDSAMKSRGSSSQQLTVTVLRMMTMTKGMRIEQDELGSLTGTTQATTAKAVAEPIQDQGHIRELFHPTDPGYDSSSPMANAMT